MRRGIRVTASLAGISGLLGVAACAVVPPSGPTVMALPGQGKSLQQFQQEDNGCRFYAQQETGFQQPGQAGTNAAVGSAVLGTAIGAAAGAALGAVAGNPGAGAAIGGATGLLGGSAIGANNAYATEASLQQRYNVAYTQCMYARGNTVESPPPAYAGYAAPGYGYGYGYPAYPYYAPGLFAPSIALGFGFGSGWGWHRGWGGWGGGWHGGGWGGHGGWGWHH